MNYNTDQLLNLVSSNKVGDPRGLHRPRVFFCTLSPLPGSTRENYSIGIPGKLKGILFTLDLIDIIFAAGVNLIGGIKDAVFRHEHP